MRSNAKGLGIVEILFMVVIIGVAAAIIVLLIPTKKDNKQQTKDIETITNAIRNYAINNKGRIPSTITEKDTEICKSHAENCTGLIDLSSLTLDERYLIEIPVNSNRESANGTGYAIRKTQDREVVVTALTEL